MSGTVGYSYQGRVVPKPGMEKDVERAMRAFSDWIATQPGLLRVHVMKDRTSGELVGMSFWKTKEDCDRMWAVAATSPEARPHRQVLATATQGPAESHEYELLATRTPQ